MEVARDVRPPGACSSASEALSVATFRSLLIAEPKFRGPLHATFNAGLVAAGAAAVAESVRFAAEPTHLAEVEAAFVASERPEDCAPVEWRVLDTGPPGGPGRWRNLSVARRVTAMAERERFSAVLLASTSGYQQLLSLSAMHRLARRAPATAVVLHDNWSDLVDPSRGSLATRAKHRLVKSALRRLLPPTLRLVVLQEGLGEAAIAASRNAPPRLEVLPAPLLRPRGSVAFAPRREPREPGARRFALAGVAAKGPSEWFVAAAQRVDGARFGLAGSARAGDPLLSTPGIERLGGGERLEVSAYRAALAAADFGVVLLDPEIYRWRISASALDLLAVGLPGIFNRCAFVERLFAEHGPLGWICDDRDAFLALVDRLATSDLPEYSTLSGNCVRAAAAHAPERVGERLRDLLAAAARPRGGA